MRFLTTLAGEKMEGFELRRGDAILGIVTLDPAECDFPWQGGWLEPAPAFAEVEPLFQEWERRLEAEDYGEASEAVFEQIIRPGIRLIPLAGGESQEVGGIRIDAVGRVIWR
jgi:hypothetical protein